MIIYFRIYFIFCLFSLTILFSRNYASFAGGVLRMGSSARAMAMGSGFTAEIDAGFAAYHNPASMVFLNKRQLGFSHHFMPLDRRQANTGSMKWNGKDKNGRLVDNGTYFIRLEYDQKTKWIKLIVVK